MKTKELIRQLQEADPEGETECVVGCNDPIHYVYKEDAYHDGCLEILERDHSKDPYYNICGGVITKDGMKVIIRPLSIEDAISNNPDLPVKFVGDFSHDDYYHKKVECWREEIRRINKEIEDEN